MNGTLANAVFSAILFGAFVAVAAATARAVARHGSDDVVPSSLHSHDRAVTRARYCSAAIQKPLKLGANNMTSAVDQFRLDGKVAIVTGAGGRGNSIGAAYAKGLASAGAHVVVADINFDGAKSVAQAILDAGDDAIAVHCDITDRQSVEAMMNTAERHFGGLDILVNNAALMVEVVATPASVISTEDWNRVLAVNVTGALHCAQAALPFLKRRGGGAIVNQLSAGAFPAGSVYGVSKVALLGLTTTLAREFGPHKIRVNAIAPGMTMSDAGRALTPAESPFVQALENMIPLRARGEPEELMGALLLLCSPAGVWMTGQTINVDGGWIIRN